MSPSASDRGFTLAEVLVAMAVATILGVAVVRFYKDSFKTYSTQEQVVERDQNAHYVVNKMVEVLQQAGSGLPDTGWTSLRISGSTLIVGLNPRGAMHFVTQAAPLNTFVAVGDAKPFANTLNPHLNTTHILHDFADPTLPTVRVRIDTLYNLLGFIKGIKDNATGLDSLKLAFGVVLQVGDCLYGYRQDHYLLFNSNLVIRPNGSSLAQMVLAENIDSLGITFRNASGAVVTDWRTMRSASLLVRARTSKPDPHLPAPGYRIISLPMNVVLRNRI